MFLSEKLLQPRTKFACWSPGIKSYSNRTLTYRIINQLIDCERSFNENIKGAINVLDINE